MSYLASLKSPSVALSAANIRIKNIFIDFHFWPRRLMHFGGQDATNISYFLQFFLKYRTSSFFRQFSDTSRKPDQTWNPYYESQFHLTHGNGSGQCVKYYGEGHFTQFFQKIDPSKVSLLFAKVCVIWKQWDAEHLPGGAILAPKVQARSGVKLVEPVNILR